MREYSLKERTIFGGVLKLAREGNDISKITSRQIAEAAGMGKATIYDYFSSKEEIIVHSLAYTMNVQNMLMREKLAALPDFESRMMLIYSEIVDTVENSSSIFSVFTGEKEKYAGMLHQTEAAEVLRETLQEVSRTFTGVVKQARADGEINPGNMDYAFMALQGAIFACGKYADEKLRPKETICRNAYTMLIKALK